MVTPKIILYKHKTYANGLHPIIIQVVKNGKPIRKVIGKCSEKDWLSSKSRVSPRNIEAPRINNDIENALKNFGIKKIETFQKLMADRIENFKLKGQVSRHDLNEITLRYLIEFYPNVDFEDFTENFINKFAAFLIQEKRNNKNTVKEKMNILSAALKEAKKKKMIPENPFDDLRFAKEKKPKSKLTVEEIIKIKDAQLTGKMAEARDIFMSCIYLRGMRIGDMICLKPNNIVDNRTHYTEFKNGKNYNIGLPNEVETIIKTWAGNNRHGYIFSFMDVPRGVDPFVFKKGIKNAIVKINRYLKIIAKDLDIDKPISSHTARHSFSRLANATIKDTTVTRDLVRHQSLTVHESYISDVSDDLIMDDYAEQVLDKIR